MDSSSSSLSSKQVHSLVKRENEVLFTLSVIHTVIRTRPGFRVGVFTYAYM